MFSLGSPAEFFKNYNSAEHTPSLRTGVGWLRDEAMTSACQGPGPWTRWLLTQGPWSQVLPAAPSAWALPGVSANEKERDGLSLDKKTPPSHSVFWLYFNSSWRKKFIHFLWLRCCSSFIFSFFGGGINCGIIAGVKLGLNSWKSWENQIILCFIFT